MNFEEILDGVVIHDWNAERTNMNKRMITVRGHLQDENKTEITMVKEFTCEDCLQRMFKFMQEGVK